MRVLALALLLGLLFTACSTGGKSSECERFVVNELRVDTVNPRGSVGLSDGTTFVADWRDNELYRDALSGERISTPIDGEAAAGLDFVFQQVWVSHGRPANRVDVYDGATLQQRGTVRIEDGQPIAVFAASDGHALIKSQESGAVVVDGDLSLVSSIADNGPAVVVGDSEYGMLDGVLVELGCRDRS